MVTTSIAPSVQYNICRRIITCPGDVQLDSLRFFFCPYVLSFTCFLDLMMFLLEIKKKWLEEDILDLSLVSEPTVTGWRQISQQPKLSTVVCMVRYL